MDRLAIPSIGGDVKAQLSRATAIVVSISGVRVTALSPRPESSAAIFACRMVAETQTATCGARPPEDARSPIVLASCDAGAALSSVREELGSKEGMLQLVGTEALVADARLRREVLLVLEAALLSHTTTRAWRIITVGPSDLFATLQEVMGGARWSKDDPPPSASSDDLRRWARVLAHFRPEALGASEVAELQGQTRKPQPRRASRWGASLAQLLTVELGWDASLQGLRDRTLEELEARQLGGTALGDDEVVDRVVTLAGPRHRQIWESCSDHEKLILAQLAYEGFINPRRWAMARRLCERGLLRFGPQFRLPSKGFEVFVRRIVPRADLNAWETAHSTGAWRRASVTLIVLGASLVGLLSLGYPAVASSWLGAAATAVAGLLMGAARLSTLTRETLRLPGALSSLPDSNGARGG